MLFVEKVNILRKMKKFDIFEILSFMENNLK